MADNNEDKQLAKKTTAKELAKPTLKIKAVCDKRLMHLANGEKLVFDKAGDVKEVAVSLVAKYTMVNGDGETVMKPGMLDSFRIV